MQSSQRPFLVQQLVRQKRKMHFENYTNFEALCCCLLNTSSSDSIGATLSRVKHIMHTDNVIAANASVWAVVCSDHHIWIASNFDANRRKQRQWIQTTKISHLKRTICADADVLALGSIHEFEIKFYHLPTLSPPHAHIIVVSFLHHYGVREDYRSTHLAFMYEHCTSTYMRSHRMHFPCSRTLYARRIGTYIPISTVTIITLSMHTHATPEKMWYSK